MKYNTDIPLTRKALLQFKQIYPLDPPQVMDDEDLEKELEFEAKRLWASSSYIEDNCGQSDRPCVHFRAWSQMVGCSIDFFVVNKRIVACKRGPHND
jgi:hypothetical protein